MRSLLTIATAALIIAAASSAASAAHGSPHATVHGHAPHSTATTNNIHRVGVVRRTTAKSNYRSGWGYGRGWCYWHPYRCYYRAR